MAGKTKAEQRSRAAWWDRRPWPCAVLGVDPGAKAGASLALPFRLEWITENARDGFKRIGELPWLAWSRSIDSWTRELEQAVDDAVVLARALDVPLVMVTEAWGRGGPLGIEGWLGLGAARGHWERAARLRSMELGSPFRRTKPYVRVKQTAWRSMMIESWGSHVDGKWVPHSKDDWGPASLAALRELQPELAAVTSDDAAESGLIALYGTRCDEVGAALPKRLLRSAGFAAP